MNKETAMPLVMSTVLLMGGLMSGCTVDTEIPDSALMSCTAVGQCPDGWACDLGASLCRRTDEGHSTDSETLDAVDAAPADEGDGGTSEEPVHRYEDKQTICEAIWTKAQDCESALVAALGEKEAAVFEMQMDAFSEQICIPEMLQEKNDAELDLYLAQREMLQHLSCEQFITTVVAP